MMSSPLKTNRTSVIFGRTISVSRTIWCCLAILGLAASARAQVYYSQQTGSPTFTTADPAQLGFVNMANGNLHLEIPIASMPQRGSVPFTAKLVYDSAIWQVTTSGGTKSWKPVNVPNSYGGWRMVTTADPGIISYTTTTKTCSGGNYLTYSNFIWVAPDGTQRLLPGACSLFREF